MKSPGILVFYLLMIGVGYFLYPHVIPKREVPEQVRQKSITLSSGRTVTVTLSQIQPADFPEEVVLRKDISLSGGAVSATLEKGAVVKPIKLKGEILTVRDESLGIEGAVSIDDTNFEELAFQNIAKSLEQRGNRPAGAPEADAVAEAAAKQAEEAAAVALAAKKAAEEEVARLAAEKAAAEEAAAIAAAEANKVLSEDEIVALMKAQLEASPLGEFQIDQVTAYRAGPKEAIEGKEYQTGLVSYSKETIFGKRTISAKALIRGGKIDRWVSPQSGLQIQ